jgi:hypothetical protein
MKLFLIALATVIAVSVVLFWVAVHADSKTIHVHAAPGNNTVQMFDSMFANSKARLLMDGDTCTKLDGPWSTSDSGVTLRFYKLQCGNMTGWVNANWVD